MAKYTSARPWSIALLILTSSLASANTITVKKIKGQQAVVEMTSPLEVGKTYNLETESLTLQTDFSNQFKSRYNSISLGFDASLLSGNKTQENTFSFFGRYGWNHVAFEFGPTLQLYVYDKGFGVNTTYLIGGFFDYNYAENKSPKEIVYGPSIQLALGNRNFESGGSSQLAQGKISGFITWYINRSSVALRGELGYQMRRVSSSTDETTLNGAASQIYLMYYY